MFRFDMHVHTSEVSPCGHVPAKEMVRLYHEAGFSGFVLTDHYNVSYIERYGLDDWEAKTAHFLSGYHLAKQAGEEVGLTVLLGAELQLAGAPNEYLLYGLTEEFLYAHPSLYSCDPMQLRSLADENGFLIFQAHPYRPGLSRGMPGFLDGIEVFNGNPRHNSRNDMALSYAESNHLLQSSGSDAHQPEDVGLGGICTEQPVQTLSQLKEILKSGAYTLIRDGK